MVSRLRGLWQNIRPYWREIAMAVLLLLLLIIAWILFAYWMDDNDTEGEAISALSLFLLKYLANW
jgi:hypothetical protein